MHLYSYVTETCREDAERHGMETEIQKLATKLEADQTLMSLDRFPPPYLKKVLGTRRVVMEERFIGTDTTLIVFLATFYRGDSEYQRFVDRDEPFLKSFRSRSPSDAELERYVRERETVPVVPLLPPSEIEHTYLAAPRIPRPHDGWMVLESALWVERMRRSDAEPWIVALWDLVQKFGDWSAAYPEDVEWWTHPTHTDLAIAFRVCPAARRFLLIAAQLPGDDRAAIRERIETPPLSAISTESSDLDLRPVSERAYPDYITLDREVWRATQEPQSKANLALSPEEADLLETMCASDETENRPAYPLFINGRPGSGKSTVLQYLFADLLDFHLRRDPAERTPRPPLYLTYSEPLLRRAKSDVESLLRCDATRNAAAPLDFSHRDTAAIIDAAFGQFRSFLVGMLPSDLRARFVSTRFMDFRTFRRMWTDRANRSSKASVRRISAELAWHIIRTYVKGMRQEAADYIDPDWYAEIPSKQQSVTREHYVRVYESAWREWYQPLCERDGWWDDQDLARTTLDLDKVDLSEYPAIFCDEAQDFTKVELELILRLSLYCRRSVPPYLLRRIPFAFAGDPFQTLNPTGFNWEAVRATFHENIAVELDRGRRGKLEFNYQELGCNYRSNEGIVRLANLVQLARGVAFSLRGLQPQRAWFAGASTVPVTFSTNDPACFAGLRDTPEAVILVPCQEGEEADYVKDDPVLQKLAYDKGIVTRNVLSAVRAKGLEFDRVVLYGFGEACLKQYPKLLELLRGSSEGVEQEQSLTFQYFLNRLYVAVTRACKQLIIVDTPAGLTDFWSIARENGPDTLLQRYNAPQWTHDNVTTIIAGAPSAWQESRQNPLELAQQFFEQATDKDEPYLFAIAASNYRAAGDTPMEQYCGALRLRAEGHFVEAGRALADLGHDEEALQCFWTAHAWSQLRAFGETRPSIRERLEWRVAGIKAAPRVIPADELALIEELHAGAIDPALLDRVLADAQWGEIVDGIVQSAESWPRDLLPDVTTAGGALTRIDSLRRAGLRVRSTLGLARLAVLAEQHTRAAEIWRGIGAVTPPEWLIDALAKSEPYPGRLDWLHRRGQHEEVIREYESHVGERLAEPDVLVVFRSYMKLGRVYQAALLAIHAEVEPLVIEALDESIRVASTDTTAAVLSWLLAQFVRTGRWTEAVVLVADGVVQRDRGGKIAIEGAAPLDPLEPLFVRAVASADALASTPDGVRRAIAQLLRALLIERPWDDVPDVTLGDAGLAFERTRRVMDTVLFYDRVLRDMPSNSEGLRFARVRWLVSKRRQSDLLPDDRAKRRVKEEAGARTAEWKLGSVQPDEYPDPRAAGGSLRLRGLASAAETQSKTTATPDEKPAQVPTGVHHADVEPSAQHVVVAERQAVFAGLDAEFVLNAGPAVFDVRLDGTKRRLEIRNRSTRDVVHVYGTTRSVKTTDDDFRIDTADAAYIIPSWGMTIEFPNTGEIVTVRCRTEQGAFIVGV